MIRRLLLALVLLALPTAARAQTIFSMDGTGGFSTSTFNFTSFVTHAIVTMTREAANCPSGGDTARLVLATSGSHAQPTWGHIKTVSDTVSQGAKRFYRYRVRFNGSTDFHGNSGPWYTKQFINGNDNSGAGGRVITWLGVGSIDDTTPVAGISKNTGSRASSNLSTTGQWNNIQFRMQSSSVVDAADGRVDIYVGADNGSEGTPTSSVTGLVINMDGTNGWTNETVGFGGEVDQTTLQTGVGHVDMNFCDVQYSTTFDSTWNVAGGGGGGGGGASSLLRKPFRTHLIDVPVEIEDMPVEIEDMPVERPRRPRYRGRP